MIVSFEFCYFCTMNNTVMYQNLGTKEYGQTWDYQEQLMKIALDIKAERFKNPNNTIDKKIDHHLLTVRHPHVYTLGKSGHMEHLLMNNQELSDHGVQFYKTNRGGDITYHGPGQLVAYPILDLEQFYTDLGRYMRNLEEVIIRTIAEYGISSTRLPGSTGVWLDVDDPSKVRKICAMGVKCSRWVTIHGLALNMNTDLSFFGHIVPCGIADKGVTSMAKELGREVDETEVERIFLQKFAEVFECTIVPFVDENA